jgi:hypothetical protein
MTLDDFLLQAANHGPCVGACAMTPTPLVPPPGVELRTVNGACIATLDGLFTTFAEAWQFPPRFIRRPNRDAFNDWMRDLDNLVNLDLTKPPARGYLTQMINPHLLLAEQPEIFPWFANKMPFYRDYYRDQAEPAAAFGLLLSASEGQLDDVRRRWLAVGVQVATVTI